MMKKTTEYIPTFGRTEESVGGSTETMWIPITWKPICHQSDDAGFGV